MLEITSHSPAETREIGRALGQFLQTGDLIALEGDLGAGKTTLVNGIAAGWRSPDQVTSPTFVLINVYRRPENSGQLNHLDAYRLSGPSEAADLDLDLYLETGPLIVEWFSRIREALPDDFLLVEMAWVGEGQRKLRFSAKGKRYMALIAIFSKFLSPPVINAQQYPSEP